MRVVLCAYLVIVTSAGPRLCCCSAVRMLDVAQFFMKAEPETTCEQCCCSSSASARKQRSQRSGIPKDHKESKHVPGNGCPCQKSQPGSATVLTHSGDLIRVDAKESLGHPLACAVPVFDRPISYRAIGESCAWLPFLTRDDLL